jgi:hypothetical protein
MYKKHKQRNMFKRLIIKIKTSLFNKKQFPQNRELVNLFDKDESVFILGTGPSINDIEISKLGNKEIISLSNFFEHELIEQLNIKIQIFAGSHPPITEEVLYNWFSRCHSKLPLNVPVLVEKRDRSVAESVFKNRKCFYYSYGGILPIDFTTAIISPWTGAVIAIQLAIYCDVSETHLLGINHEWQKLKGYKHFYNHDEPSLEFYINEAGINFEYSEYKPPLPKEELYKQYSVYQQYEMLKVEAKKKNLKIYNTDPFSSFDVFEKRDLHFGK